MTESCCRCEEPGFRTLGAWVFCRGCWLAARRVLGPDVGLGLAIVHQPHQPVDDWDLACDLCGATWIGADLSPCPWCIAREEARRSAAEAMGPPRLWGLAGLVCDACGWRWNGVHAESCRRADGVVCNGRGSAELGLIAMRRERLGV